MAHTFNPRTRETEPDRSQSSDQMTDQSHPVLLEIESVLKEKQSSHKGDPNAWYHMTWIPVLGRLRQELYDCMEKGIYREREELSGYGVWTLQHSWRQDLTHFLSEVEVRQSGWLLFFSVIQVYHNICLWVFINCGKSSFSAIVRNSFSLRNRFNAWVSLSPHSLFDSACFSSTTLSILVWSSRFTV